MNNISRLELKRNANRLSVKGLAIFLLLASAILQVGIINHKTDLKEHVEFVANETKKVERYINYHQYGGYGFNRILESSALAALFYNSTTVNDLHAFIDNGVRLKLSKNVMGKSMFARPTGGTFDFSWYILVFGGFFTIVWGFFSFRNKEYLRFLMNFSSPKGVYLGIILGRVLLIIITLAIIVCTAFIQFLINGISLTSGEIKGLLVFFLTAVIVLVLLLVVGAAFGAGENWIKGAIKTVAFFTVLVLLWPAVLDLVFSGAAAANMKSVYNLELRKIETLMAFEKESYEYTNRFETRDEKIAADKRMGEKWWERDFAKVEKLEAEMMEKTRENARKFHAWSIINPVTFYKSTNNELSSKGYNAYIDFYRDGQQKQKGFLRYFLDKKRYESYTKVEPYLAGKEYVFASKTSLPDFFAAGIVLNIIYLCAAIFFGYSRFTRFIFPVPGKETTFDKTEIKLKSGEHSVYTCQHPEFTAEFLNVFHGRVKKFNGKIIVDGKDIVSSEKKSFLYLPNIDKIPTAIKVKGLFSLIPGLREKAAESGIEKNKVFGELNSLEKARLLLAAALLEKRRFYIFNDFLYGQHHDLFDHFLSAVGPLKSNGSVIIELYSIVGEPKYASCARLEIILLSGSSYIVQVVPVEEKQGTNR